MALTSAGERSTSGARPAASPIDIRLPSDREWAESLEPGWQQRRMENFNNLVTGIFEPEDLVNDGWTDIIGKLLVRMREGG